MLKNRNQPFVAAGVTAAIIAIVCFVAALVKGLWWICGMAEWTGLGPLPWGAAFFIVLVFGSTGASSKS